jgi:DnaJ-class molecular chaperone
MAVIVFSMADCNLENCSSCEGSGKCYYCNGTGITHWEDPEKPDEDCYTCKGTGNCITCDGTGKVEKEKQGGGKEWWQRGTK